MVGQARNGLAAELSRPRTFRPTFLGGYGLAVSGSSRRRSWRNFALAGGGRVAGRRRRERRVAKTRPRPTKGKPAHNVQGRRSPPRSALPRPRSRWDTRFNRSGTVPSAGGRRFEDGALSTQIGIRSHPECSGRPRGPSTAGLSPHPLVGSRGGAPLRPRPEIVSSVPRSAAAPTACSRGDTWRNVLPVGIGFREAGKYGQFGGVVGPPGFDGSSGCDLFGLGQQRGCMETINFHNKIKSQIRTHWIFEIPSKTIWSYR
mmetsp:Transcript_50312/g.98424  ORF Transcript_50312/g.98424 Transcript_50312/m.98424 type:complete len:259 (-) Transcript_50312:167-943(-)